MVAYLKGVRAYNDAFGQDIGKNVDRAAIVGVHTANTGVKKPELYEKMVMPGLDPDGRVNASGMTADMQWFLSKGFIKQPVDLATVIDDSFVDQAVRQLGPYGK